MSQINPGFISVDLSIVPDVRPVLPPAVYNFRIDSVECKPPRDVANKGVVWHIGLSVANHPTENGRQMTTYVYIPENPKPDDLVQLRRLVLSAGLEAGKGGVNMMSLVGRTITALVTNKIDKDKRSGQQRTYADVGEIFIPSDGVKPGAVGPTDGNGAPAQSQDMSAALLGGSAPVSQPTPTSPPIPQPGEATQSIPAGAAAGLGIPQA